MQAKYEKERRLFEEEKRKRMLDIQQSIDKLNIASSDKEKLRQEIDMLNREQKELNQKIEETEIEVENEKSKKRQIEREINELNIQINSQKVSGAKEESQRIVWMREEIAKKQIEINSAQRQYKDLIDNKFDIESSPVRSSGLSRGDNQSILKLEQEMK